MQTPLRRNRTIHKGFILAAALFLLIAGCGGGTQTRTSITIFSDVHFNPFYDPAVFHSLVNASEDQWNDIFQTSSVTDPQSWGNETNYPLLVSMLKAVQMESTGNPVVVFSGDMLAHEFSKKFYELYGSEDEAAMRAFTYKTVAFFVGRVRAHLGEIPVIFTLGNNDSYRGDYQIEPGGAFLADTADLLYSTFLLAGTDYAGFVETYRAGGYYAASAGPVLFISLNTILFSYEAAPDVEEAVSRELDWFEQTLAGARSQGEKVWLVLHIPPGADIYGTVHDYMDSSGHISDARTLWKTEHQDRFLEIIDRYTDLIDASFAGHTHMDEYRFYVNRTGASQSIIVVTPGISPIFDNDPASRS